MNDKLKKDICEALRLYVAKYPSQNKAAASLDGTSAGTVSSILSGKWENISDEMWKKKRRRWGARRRVSGRLWTRQLRRRWPTR